MQARKLRCLYAPWTRLGVPPMRLPLDVFWRGEHDTGRTARSSTALGKRTVESLDIPSAGENDL